MSQKLCNERFGPSPKSEVRQSSYAHRRATKTKAREVRVRQSESEQKQEGWGGFDAILEELAAEIGEGSGGVEE